MRILWDYFENFFYLPGVITHLYRSHPIRMIAIEDKNIGNFCAVMLKLQSISELWSPKGQFSDTIALKLIGRVRVHSIKSDNATVPMKALCAVRILFLQKNFFLEISKMLSSWNHVMNFIILFLSPIPMQYQKCFRNPTFKFLWYAKVKEMLAKFCSWTTGIPRFTLLMGGLKAKTAEAKTA